MHRSDADERALSGDDHPAEAAGVDPGESTSDGGSEAASMPSVWSRTDWYVVVALVLGSLLLVGIHARAYPTLSPIDELQHLDYAIKGSDFRVPLKGDRVGFEAMAEAACRSVDAPNYLGPECGLDSYDPNDFQERGFNTATPQFPIYYTITGVLADGIGLVGPIDSFVTAARLVGGLWLGAAWAVIWFTMALIGIGRRARAAAVALFFAAPMLIFHSATINTDAALFLTGALTLMATVLVDTGRLRARWLVPIMLVLYLVEPTVMLMIAVSICYLGVRFATRPGADWKVWAIPIVALVGLAMLRMEIVPWFHDLLYPPRPRRAGGGRAPMFQNREEVEITLDLLQAELNALVTPVAYPYVPPAWRGASTYGLIKLVNWFAIAALMAAAVFAQLERRVRLLAGLTVATLLVAGPFYTFYYAYFSDVFYPAPARFGLPLMGVVVLLVAATLRRTGPQLIAGSLGVLTAVNAVWYLAF